MVAIVGSGQKGVYPLVVGQTEDERYTRLSSPTNRKSSKEAPLKKCSKTGIRRPKGVSSRHY